MHETEQKASKKHVKVAERFLLLASCCALGTCMTKFDCEPSITSTSSAALVPEKQTILATARAGVPRDYDKINTSLYKDSVRKLLTNPHPLLTGHC